MSADKYSQLIESVELNKIELLTLTCNQNGDFPIEKREDLELALKNNVIQTKIDGLELQVEFQFGVVAFNKGYSTEQFGDIEDLSQENILFKINFSLALSYILDLEEYRDILMEKFNEEIETFVEHNVPMNAWPYARETISSITTRMGFPALIIPTYKNLYKG